MTVVQTVLTIVITYWHQSTIDGVTTEFTTLDVTTTIPGLANKTITHTTPSFTWSAGPGQIVTLAAGPTYVAYTNIWGGLDAPFTDDDNDPATYLSTAVPQLTCYADMSYVPSPTKEAEYQHFIETYANGVPDSTPSGPALIPPGVINKLKNMPAVLSIFKGSDIATCTLRGPSPGIRTLPAYTTGPNATPINPAYPTTAPPPLGSFVQTPSTYVSTTYKGVETHVSRSGCLKCTQNAPLPIPPFPSVQPSKQEEPPAVTNSPEKDKQNPDIPDIVASILRDPQFTQPQGQNEQSITIGDSIFRVRPAEPTQTGQQNENQKNPVIVVGSETLSPGQSATLNGLVVINPTQGQGTKIVVDGSTIAVNNNNPGPTSPPVLTVGPGNTLTANPQGQFVVGTQTLTPGGPAITVDGSTLSLGPSGTIAVVNGVTQTLGNSPAVTNAPVLTVAGQTISATVIGGSTQFVLAPGKTLTPGGVLTVDGTTFSLPTGVSGSTIVVNGVTSTLKATNAPVITVNSQSVTASVVSGTTAFVIGPGQTLTPGGTITVSGTTISMPASASGSVIVVNGVTSTLQATGSPVLTLNSQLVTASVVGGTTAFVVGPGQTLTPGGVITVSGTTISMPASASGSVIVVNGVTSTLGRPGITAAPALTIEGKTFSATVRDGTTEYVLGPGTTLKPGDAITISGTTYSLDSKGTALVINGKTSSIPKTPTSNSATTTGSGSQSSSSGSSSRSSTSTWNNQRNPGNFIASGIGINSPGGAMGKSRGLDKMVEGMVIGVAGWLLMFL